MVRYGSLCRAPLGDVSNLAAVGRTGVQPVGGKDAVKVSQVPFLWSRFNFGQWRLMGIPSALELSYLSGQIIERIPICRRHGNDLFPHRMPSSQREKQPHLQ